MNSPDEIRASLKGEGSEISLEEAQELSQIQDNHEKVINLVKKKFKSYASMLDSDSENYDVNTSGLAQSLIWDVLRMLDIPSSVIINQVRDPERMKHMKVAEVTIIGYLNFYGDLREQGEVKLV